MGVSAPWGSSQGCSGFGRPFAVGCPRPGRMGRPGGPASGARAAAAPLIRRGPRASRGITA
eukprot:574102-Lingulodinium_polyedra.AAC.1